MTDDHLMIDLGMGGVGYSALARIRAPLDRPIKYHVYSLYWSI